MRPNKILLLAVLALFLLSSFTVLMAREKSTSGIKPVNENDIGDPYDPTLDADPWDDNDDGGPGMLEVGPGIVIFDLPVSGWSFFKFRFISFSEKTKNDGSVSFVKPNSTEKKIAK